jgi:peptide/nickel transport system substrate-binding protein
MKLDRRNFMKASAMAGVAAGLPVVNAAFFSSPAFAGQNKPLTFLSAENLTGNWDPTAHTALSQIIYAAQPRRHPPRMYLQVPLSGPAGNLR